MTNGFQSVLHASGPAAERRKQLDLYAFLVGSWTAEVRTHDDAGAIHRGAAEIHAGWVLEGRAIQDVWMIPDRAHRAPDAPRLPVAGNWYGTTLRIYDPAIDAWRIQWSDPATNRFLQQIGRADGADIVQEGDDGRGGVWRWRFTKIEPGSFHWLGEHATKPGGTWTLRVEVLAHRTA
jgi:hypothetical protein